MVCRYGLEQFANAPTETAVKRMNQSGIYSNRN